VKTGASGVKSGASGVKSGASGVKSGASAVKTGASDMATAGTVGTAVVWVRASSWREDWREELCAGGGDLSAEVHGQCAETLL